MDVRLYPGNYIYSRRKIKNIVGGSAFVPVHSIFVSKQHTPAPKAIAFDLDETIGSFSDLYLIWLNIPASSRTQSTFNQILDLYPEFLRTDIISILAFIQTKVARGECKPIYLYTNNQCEDPSWIDHILVYLESKLRAEKLFSRPVRAFKIKDVRVEPNRTTHEKTYKEFVKCSMLRSTELCYVDDIAYDKMKHGRVYFIQPPPYQHRLSIKQIRDRLRTIRGLRLTCEDKSLSNMNCVSPQKDGFSLHLFSFKSPTSCAEMNETSAADCASSMRNGVKEEEISAKIMYYIREFFLVSLRRGGTRKQRKHLARFTRKKRVP